jgi:hypothetical protein
VKRRDPLKLPDDAQLMFRIGQLTGASVMTAHWLGLQEDPKLQELGRRLLECAAPFLQGDESGPRGLKPSA